MIFGSFSSYRVVFRSEHVHVKEQHTHCDDCVRRRTIDVQHLNIPPIAHAAHIHDPSLLFGCAWDSVGAWRFRIPSGLFLTFRRRNFYFVMIWMVVIFCFHCNIFEHLDPAGYILGCFLVVFSPSSCFSFLFRQYDYPPSSAGLGSACSSRTFSRRK